MISSINSSLSAIDAFGKKMGVTANNIANIESEGFKKSRAVLQEGLNGGVEVDISQIESQGDIIYDKNVDGQIIEKELSNVDLAEEIPQTIPVKIGYEANLKVIETQEKMVGSLLDIMG